MKRLDVWLTEHLWAQVVLSVVAATALIMLISPGHTWGETLVRVAVVSLGGVVVLVVRRRKEKRTTGGSDATVATLDRKLRRGEVPREPAEREAMAKLVAQRLHATRHRRAALVLLYVMFATLAVAVTATTDARSAIGYGLFSVVFLGWMTWSAARQHRLLRHMAEAVDTGAVTGTGTPGAAHDTRARTRPGQ
ncbi:hypothetical protein [Streptomyces sp. NPDC006368]|uniref:hypothetical protein n=1 Tax=Streptomyces sp. NPDC006368 TaxID=3156760 RepID=UPI0033B88F6D